MKVKTSELTEKALDWAVAKAIGQKVDDDGDNGFLWLREGAEWELWNPSYDWEQCGPLIEKFHVDVNYFKDGDCVAQPYGSPKYMDHIDPKIAICRAVVASVLGDEIELPEGLQ
ncbi:phage protein NinX family protein [Symbiopectobacterium purcellii]|uniref:DUF2591 domain-containing protein n=1 Tax=Symbiopectobacterium purcellii TaxID=2871826 RepID=A0ABX9ASS1_9ENTR|nr:phage protein NinX family protein [Symbiopectobacterium purcellii]QZN97811.1 DUF2591 domain-containing protein [Symbiopectobacterium purcellii]